MDVSVLYVVLLARGSCSALAEVFWCARPRPVILLAERLWSASGRRLLHHRAVPHWACQSGWLAARRQHLTSLCEMQQCWNGASHEILLVQSATEKTPLFGALLLTSPSTPVTTEHAALRYINYSFILIEFGWISVHLDKWKVANVTIGFLSWVPEGGGHRIPCEKYSHHYFASLSFLLCCREISHLARADR